MRTILRLVSVGLPLRLTVASICLLAAHSVACQEVTFPKKTGIQTPGVQHTMEELPKTATITVKGDPDWLAVTSDAVWVTSENTDSVIRLDPGKNRVGTQVKVNKPCSGLDLEACGFRVAGTRALFAWIGRLACCRRRFRLGLRTMKAESQPGPGACGW